MNLFNTDITTNRLPYDGEVHYYGKIMDTQQAQFFFNNLLETIVWKNDEAVMFGKLIVTPRKVAWYGQELFKYTYSNTTKTAFPWTPALLELKALIEEKTGETFNACLLNLYHSGTEGMGWHSDGETDLKKNGAIASLSFGAERLFAFKHKETKQTISLILERGSLLVMKGNTQKHWLHRLPPTKKINTARINLTFRTIVKKENLPEN
ncbi:alpha-ketoglutarate-dependent dioxygenase AlkB [Wenyingzhuangia sp. 1_MG-2023]|nr:alpha-ketoglutarate-dependent dioxygenase AlkB [Wenyingzhuangia sp. 1_MG-2023]